MNQSFYATCQFGENVNDLESLQVVDEDVRNPQAVDQLQVDWKETVLSKGKRGEFLQKKVWRER